MAAASLCEAIALSWLIIYRWLVAPSLFPLSRTHIYTQISDESPSSHHHSGAHTHTNKTKQKKPVQYSHIHKHTPPQCCSVHADTVPACKIKTYSSSPVKQKQSIPLYTNNKTGNVDFTVSVKTERNMTTRYFKPLPFTSYLTK